MKVFCTVALLITAAVGGCRPRTHAAQPTPGWNIYSNAKYGYEIQYPDGYDLWETGSAGDRDGASIRIGFSEYQAPTPMLDIQIEPRTPEHGFPTIGMHVPDMDVSLKNTTVNGRPGRLALYRWSTNGELAFAEMYVQGVVFRFEAAPGTTDFEATAWWDIVSTFRLTRE